MASSYYLAQTVDSKSGSTRRDEFKAVSKMRGKLHDDLAYPDLPPIFSPLLDSFNSLDSYSFQEIKAYTEMTGVSLDAFDIGIIKDIDFIKRCIDNGRNVKQVLEAFKYGTD